ncbi:hypothetical protein ACFPOI_16245 [Nonomuraea angiospora]|uniref:Uncharacterized protein n=1 Tax=Nonomuraea angiospora TaxID=46172 RepID=A0ABR9MHD3_9ACTN|nr:hypothetical protein [Nonomuraea angiospora]MBE1592184.1 hypothetical protein [Nonomuraea angiospora]
MGKTQSARYSPGDQLAGHLDGTRPAGSNGDAPAGQILAARGL